MVLITFVEGFLFLYKYENIIFSMKTTVSNYFLD